MVMAFWNINTGKGSFWTRQDTFARWCAARRPDLLFLEEVSHTLADDLPALTRMESLGFVNTLDKNDDQSTKQLHALATPTVSRYFKCRTLTFPGLKSKRALLKVTARSGPIRGAAIWVLHANASRKGGSQAVTAVNAYLDDFETAIVGGDFNYAAADAGLKVVRPLSWQNTRLRFTQWNKTSGATNSPDDRLQLVSARGTVIYAKVVPHRVIDYVIAGSDRRVQPTQNCTSEELWRDILTCFDHCPVVYNVR